MTTELRWHEWLTKSYKEIEALGFNPKERFDRIGHKRALSSRWALTIGMWGLRTPTEIMTAVGGMNPGDSSRGTFDVFKNRHRLFAGPQFARYMASQPNPDERDRREIWTQCELATWVHGRTRERVEAMGFKLIGTILDAVRLYFHLLPIEVYLYYRAVEDILENALMGRQTWIKLDDEERRSMWNNALGPGQPMVVECPDEVRYALKSRDEEAVVH